MFYKIISGTSTCSQEGRTFILKKNGYAQEISKFLVEMEMISYSPMLSKIVFFVAYPQHCKGFSIFFFKSPTYF